MHRASKFALIIFIAIVAFIVGIRVQHSSSERTFKEGYERGTWHTALYLKYKGKLPSGAWREKAWRFTNAVDAEWWVDVVEASE